MPINTYQIKYTSRKNVSKTKIVEAIGPDSVFKIAHALAKKAGGRVYQIKALA